MIWLKYRKFFVNNKYLSISFLGNFPSDRTNWDGYSFSVHMRKNYGYNLWGNILSQQMGLDEMKRRVTLCVGMVLLALLGFGCSVIPAAPVIPTPTAGLFVDPVFLEYYNYLGGIEMLGPAISPKFIEGSKVVQYVAAGEMIFEASAPAARRFRMAPLGVVMGIKEPAVEQSGSPELLYVNGHIIYPDFRPLYEKLGAHTVGKPLTEVRHNLIRRRYEQYFENLGFYRLEGSSDVHLLAYGVMACKDACQETGLTQENAVDVSSTVDPTFQSYVNKQGTDFTGFVLSNAYGSTDGKWEQILENVVLIADDRVSAESVSLRPLTEKLNILAESPKPPSNDPSMHFYAIQDNTGYDIPLYFWDYIEKHGGITTFGPPISHYSLLKDQIYHQCFRNVCLAYDLSVTEGARIRPEPLGYAYRVLYFNQPSSTPQPTPLDTPVAVVVTAEPTMYVPLTPENAGIDTTQVAPQVVQEASPQPSPESAGQAPAATAPQAETPGMRELEMQVWERYAVIESKQGQEIGIWVLENNRPIENALPELTVKMPDGNYQTFQMPATGANGQSSYMLPMMGAPNGTIVPYKACVAATDALKMCVMRFFVIWSNP
jgi:hypothetical protein